MSKTEILNQALAARDQEILEYQVNIDNYRLAIADIDALDDSEMADFRTQLCDLLKSSSLEQKKAKLIRNAVAQQLGVEKCSV